MKKGMPIAVVGSVNSDYSVFMERLPMPGETVLATDSGRFAGGKGLNQAVAAHRAGGDVRFRFSVGDDEDGSFLTGFLTAEAMAVDVLQDPDLPTSKAYILVDQLGENQISVIPGANYSQKLSRTQFPQGPALLVLQLEIGNENNLALARQAKQVGWKVVLTPAPSSQFDAALLEYVDILMLNESEAAQISGSHDFMTSGKAVSQKARIAFLTRGASGVSVFENGELLGHVDALVVSSVDATGAGDTFCGYAVAGLSQGLDAMAAAKLGTIAAGISVQSRGASNSIPFRNEVDQLLSKT